MDDKNCLVDAGHWVDYVLFKLVEAYSAAERVVLVLGNEQETGEGIQIRKLGCFIFHLSLGCGRLAGLSPWDITKQAGL